MIKEKAKSTDWFKQGLNSGWIQVNETELLRFFEQEFGSINQTEKLFIVFLNIFLRNGHLLLPTDKSPAEWGEIIDADKTSIDLLANAVADLSKIDIGKIIGSADDNCPIVITDRGLSFRKQWVYENSLMDWIQSSNQSGYKDVEPKNAKNELERLFSESDQSPDLQKTAAALSVLKPFLMISGGPGTGKTTTIAKIIALHLRLTNCKIKIALAAPTGKAAGRMGESLLNQIDELNLNDEELHAFPKEAKTIHRLLIGTEERGLLPPVENKLLKYDLIIVDEASMIDLTLMHRLVHRLKKGAGLILLGDKNQLASVEAGAVFADLCRKQSNSFSEDTLEWLSRFNLSKGLSESDSYNLDDSLIYLTKSYRFGESSGIGKLAEFVNNGDADIETTDELFNSHDDLKHNDFEYGESQIKKMGIELIDKIKSLKSINDPAEAMKIWKEHIFLIAHRRGLDGSERLNNLMEQLIAASRQIQFQNGWYHGRLIMITQNDYNAGVFNGDLGFCLMSADGKMYVYIESGSGMKKIRTQDIMHYTPAYFLTVHKSQGSEFDNVTLLLPSKESPILTKELIYTALTRARHSFHLKGELKQFCKAAKKRTIRYSGLSNEFC